MFNGEFCQHYHSTVAAQADFGGHWCSGSGRETNTVISSTREIYETELKQTDQNAG